jgi:hypothetical protein
MFAHASHPEERSTPTNYIQPMQNIFGAPHRLLPCVRMHAVSDYHADWRQRDNREHIGGRTEIEFLVFSTSHRM